MAQVRITGWNPGFNKVGATKAIRAMAVVDLAHAKSITDAVMAGNDVTIRLPDEESAAQLASELSQLGANAYREETDCG
jgi:hypothetical protein